MNEIPAQRQYYPARILLGLFIGLYGAYAALNVIRVFNRVDLTIFTLILLPFFLSVIAVLFWPFANKFNFSVAAIGLTPITLYFNYIPSGGPMGGQAGLALIVLPVVHLICLGILLIPVIILELVYRFKQVNN